MKRNKWPFSTALLSILIVLLISGLSFSADRDKDDTAKKKTTKKETIVKQQTNVSSATIDKKGSTDTRPTTNTQSGTAHSGDIAKGVSSPIDATGDSPFQPLSAKSSPATGEQILWQVIASGGNRSTSTNFILSGTAGQFAIGSGGSTNYKLLSGFWQNFASGGCCLKRGNINGSGDLEIDISDLTYLVAYMFGGGAEPPCIDEGNTNGSGDGEIDISDLTYLVAYMFGGGPPPPGC